MVGIPDGWAERLVDRCPSCLDAGIEAEMWKSIKSDPPPNTDAVVQFFQYRQSVDPNRFDHYHPKVAASLAKIDGWQAASRRRRTTRTTSTTISPTDQAQSSPPRSRRERRMSPRSPSRQPTCWQSAWQDIAVLVAPADRSP